MWLREAVDQPWLTRVARAYGHAAALRFAEDSGFEVDTNVLEANGPAPHRAAPLHVKPGSARALPPFRWSSKDSRTMPAVADRGRVDPPPAGA